jgi:hypothetical protein
LTFGSAAADLINTGRYELGDLVSRVHPFFVSNIYANLTNTGVKKVQEALCGWCLLMQGGGGYDRV